MGGCRELVKIDEPVWKNSICNELGRLSQGCQTHAVTGTIYFILHRDKPKYIIATYVRAVCDIIPKKTETHIIRLTAGGNIIDYPGQVSAPTSDLNTMKLHINRSISNIKSQYMCIDVEYSTLVIA